MMMFFIGKKIALRTRPEFVIQVGKHATYTHSCAPLHAQQSIYMHSAGVHVRILNHPGDPSW